MSSIECSACFSRSAWRSCPLEDVLSDLLRPALKELIANSSKDHQKSLRGKAFECALPRYAWTQQWSWTSMYAVILEWGVRAVCRIRRCQPSRRRSRQGRRPWVCGRVTGARVSCRGMPRILHCEDAFVDDAHGIMQIMVHYIRAGFEADDQTREYVHEAA